MYKSAMMTVVCAAALILTGCTTAPQKPEEKAALKQDASNVMKSLTAADPNLQRFMDQSYAHVIFPSVGKGGVLVGGAYGRGIVYEQGQFVGYADLTQASIGAQLGGQTFAELICFDSKEAFERFTSNRLEFKADASAVILKSGAARAAKYTDGVAVFVRPNGGAMFEASVGAQQFTYQPK